MYPHVSNFTFIRAWVQHNDDTGLSYHCASIWPYLPIVDDTVTVCSQGKLQLSSAFFQISLRPQTTSLVQGWK